LAVVAAVLLGAWLLPVGAASTDSQETPTISVNGIAKVEVVPDIGTVKFVVETTQETASKAMAEVTKRYQRRSGSCKRYCKGRKEHKHQ